MFPAHDRRRLGDDLRIGCRHIFCLAEVGRQIDRFSYGAHFIAANRRLLARLLELAVAVEFPSRARTPSQLS